jgi:hypothetical protein
MEPIITSELSFNEKMVLPTGQIPVCMSGNECTNFAHATAIHDQT